MGTNADAGEQQEYSVGARFAITCRPRCCRVVDDSVDPPCIVGAFYEPGCCIATDPGCSGEDQCGELCPNDIPTIVDDCDTLDCYEWDDDEYIVQENRLNLDCFNAGYYDDGKESCKWAIICGPQYSRGAEAENRAPYEYQCFAIRDGVYPDMSAELPCQFLQLLLREMSGREICNCNTVDVIPFGLPIVEDTPFLTEEDCPVLCFDAGYEKARFACYGFPGGTY